MGKSKEVNKGQNNVNVEEGNISVDHKTVRKANDGANVLPDDVAVADGEVIAGEECR